MKFKWQIYLSLFSFSLLLGLSFILPSNTAKADYQQTAVNGHFFSDAAQYCAFQDTGGTITRIGGRTNENCFWQSTNASVPNATITSVTLSLRNAGHYTDDFYITLLCNGNIVNSATTSAASISSTNFDDTTFNFSSGVNCNGSASTGVDLSNAGTDPDLWIAGTNVDITPNVGVSNSSIGGGTFNDNFEFRVSFNSPFTSVTTNSISWQDPPFTDGFQSPDFSLWQTCVSIYNGAAGNSIGYDITVHYGNSTSTMTNTDSLSSQFGYAPLRFLPIVNECSGVNKATSTPPGTYYAYATLTRHTAFSGDTALATSSIISFEITPGFTVVAPGNTAYCSTVGVTDPIKHAFGCKIPFVYAYQLLELAQNLIATDTTSTLTSASLIFPAIPLLRNATFTIPFIDQTEIYKILPPSSWDFIKLMEGAAVIISFGLLFFHRIKGFWGGGSDTEHHI